LEKIHRKNNEKPQRLDSLLGLDCGGLLRIPCLELGNELVAELGEVSVLL